MPPLRQQPIFIGQPQTTGTTYSASSATSKIVFTASAADGSAVTGIHLFFASAVSVDILLKTTIGATTTSLFRLVQAVSARQVINLCSATYMPHLNADTPIIQLRAGQTLSIDAMASFASTFDVTVFGGHFN